MATYHGQAGINFGVNSTIIGVNGHFQTREHSYGIQKDQVRDGGDTTTSVVYYDPVERAVFSYVAYQWGVNQGNAAVDMPTIGQWVQVIDPSYSYVAGWWICEDITIQSSNTTAARVTVALSRYPYVPRI